MSNVDVGADPESGSAPRPSPGDAPALVLVRHGETEWSKSGRHTGCTDIPLTEVGEQQAAAVGDLVQALLGGRTPYVISSPRQRALTTARLAGFEPDEITELAAEWDYGDREGLTSAQITQIDPDWTIWTGSVPGGESADQITERIDALLAHTDAVRSAQPDRPVLLFSHGHASRCLAARWLGAPVASGANYWLTTAAACSLGHERGRPVILRWNLDASLSRPPVER